jgi:hypothetical protein
LSGVPLPKEVEFSDYFLQTLKRLCRRLENANIKAPAPSIVRFEEKPASYPVYRSSMTARKSQQHSPAAHTFGSPSQLFSVPSKDALSEIARSGNAEDTFNNNSPYPSSARLKSTLTATDIESPQRKVELAENCNVALEQSSRQKEASSWFREQKKPANPESSCTQTPDHYAEQTAKETVRISLRTVSVNQDAPTAQDAVNGTEGARKEPRAMLKVSRVSDLPQSD